MHQCTAVVGVTFLLIIVFVYFEVEHDYFMVIGGDCYHRLLFKFLEWNGKKAVCYVVVCGGKWCQICMRCDEPNFLKLFGFPWYTLSAILCSGLNGYTVKLWGKPIFFLFDKIWHFELTWDPKTTEVTKGVRRSIYHFCHTHLQYGCLWTLLDPNNRDLAF